MAKDQALSLRAQWLGERLRKARNEAGYTLREVGEYLKLRHATISRFENGVYRIRPSYVRDLIDFYGISDRRQRDALLQLNEDAWQQNIWHAGLGDLEAEFIDFSWLEARASRIKTYDPLLISGLLQTPEYTAAVTRIGLNPQATKDAIEQAVRVREARQTILNTKSPTRFNAIFEETALRRVIGDRTVHAEQLRHLIQVATSDHVEIRVLDPTAGWHPGLDGPFTLMEMPAPYPDVAYVENLVGRTFLEEPTKVAMYRQAYDGLHRIARTPDESAKYIEGLLEVSP